MLVAPFEYHVEWFVQWQKDAKNILDAATEPLAHGALFFYAIIILVEALMRLDMFPELAKEAGSRLLRLGIYLTFVPFVAFLLIGVRTKLGPGWYEVQFVTSALALFISVFTHCFVEKKTEHLATAA